MPKAEVTRICIYCDTWAGGGIETFLTRLLTHMDRTGFAIDVWCAQKDSDCFDEALAKSGIAVRSLRRRHGGGAARKTLESILPLYQICRDEKYDVVHLNLFQGLSLLLAVAVRLGGVKRVIVHSHGAGLRNSRSRGLKYAIHIVSKHLLALAPTERWAASGMAGNFLFPRRFPVDMIPNGIDAERFLFQQEIRARVRDELGVGNKKVLGCVGRLDSQKNQGYLLELTAALTQRGEDVCLLLVGDGEDMPRLKSQAKRLDVEDRVIFYGYSGEIPQLMWAMDVLLVPSLTEGLCIAALEGQAAGLPVICSTGVPKEISICQNVYFETLESQGRWIQRVQSCQAMDRTGQNKQIRRSPFQIETSCAIVREKYKTGTADGMEV